MRYMISLLAVLFLALPALAQGAYKVKPGDVLQVEVLEDASLNRKALVLPDGTISFPLAGAVRAAGRTVDQIKNTLADRLASNFATKPTVFVALGALGKRPAGTPRTISIFALGELAKPGEHKMRRGTTLLQFLAQSGGFTKFAATKRIQIRRRDPATGQEHVFRFNYDALEKGRGRGFGPLRDGDVIVVPQRRLFE